MGDIERYQPIPGDWGQPLDEELHRISAHAGGLSDDLAQYKLNAATYFPWKALACQIEGQGASDPLLRADAWNTTSVTRQGVGLYRFTVTQTTILGTAWNQVSYPLLSIYAPGTGVYPAVQFVAATATTFDIQVDEFYLQGQNMRVQPYDLVAGDLVWVMMLLNITADGAEALPASATTARCF